MEIFDNFRPFPFFSAEILDSRGNFKRIKISSLSLFYVTEKNIVALFNMPIA